MSTPKRTVVVVPLTVAFRDLDPQHMFGLISDQEYPSQVTEVDNRAVAWAEVDVDQADAYAAAVDVIAEQHGFDTETPEHHTIKEWQAIAS